MSVISALTGVSLEIKSHSFCYVCMNGGTTLHPCLSFQRLACETRTTQKMSAGVEQCSHHGVQHICNRFFPVQNMVNFEGIYLHC